MRNIFCFLITTLFSVSFAQQHFPPVFEVISWDEQPVIKQGDKGTEDIQCGFEGGTVVKIDDTYHLFPTERIGVFCTEKTRIGHWKSKDGIKWERISTILESTGDTSGNDRRAVFFAAMPVYDENEQVWNLFYVSYRYKKTPKRGYNHHDGHIWRAVSIIKGKNGISGPYNDINIILQPDSETQSWEGHQGVDSFFPFLAGDKWYGFYGSAKTEVMPEKPCSFWAVGLAEAPSLAGPWKRCKEGNPIKLLFGEKNNTLCMPENPIVYKLKDDSYIAIIDYVSGAVSSNDGEFIGKPEANDNDQPTYMISKDGLNWTFGGFFTLDPKEKRWWNEMRTPLALIEEKDGTYTMFFTAYKHYRGFASIGRARIKIVN